MSTRNILVALTALAIVGCQSKPQPEPWNTEKARPVVTIRIQTLPPGAIIYANAEYIGTAPLELKVVADSDGNWPHPMRIQAFVPHDANSYEEAVFPKGYRVPSRLLLRVPGYTQWYSATQRMPPNPLQSP
jgi:hypothetical protein